MKPVNLLIKTALQRSTDLKGKRKLRVSEAEQPLEREKYQMQKKTSFIDAGKFKLSSA